MKSLACPACRKTLRFTVTDAHCPTCGRVYPVVDGIPLLVRHAARGPSIGHPVSDQKLTQAMYFDTEGVHDFEVERPTGTPSLYGWLLSEKYRRGTTGVERDVAAGRVLVACAGSGMDAEFLVRLGAARELVLCDISLGALGRAQERARRHGLAFQAVVGDAESLPFTDDSFDVAFVHDGLHHLEEPLAGVAEMARVARRAVSITEPARAGVTALAVRLGLALEQEEAGNRVARLRLRDVDEVLAAAGFSTIMPHRYAMYYRHEPGRAMRLLSRARLLGPARRAFQLINRVAGNHGNKMAVQAVAAIVGDASQPVGADASPPRYGP